MASLREIRRKIKSVKSTQQITKAMKMVASARLRKAQQQILSARPFAQKMEEMAREVLARVSDVEEFSLFKKPVGNKRILVLMTSDKGLCGAFNTNLIREAIRYLRKHGEQQVRLYIVGRKGRDYFKRVKVDVMKEFVGIAGKVTFAQAELIVGELVDAYRSGAYAGIDVLYNEFKSIIQQKIVLKPFLPLEAVASNKREIYPDYIYEPKKELLLEELWTRYLRAQVYRILLESAASELGARMSAMENASSNAKDLLADLTLTLNRSRQASITKEILEVVSGAEALK